MAPELPHEGRRPSDMVSDCPLRARPCQHAPMPDLDAPAVDARPGPGPGDRHLLTDMDVAMLLVSRQRCLARAPLTDAVRSPAGCALAGVVLSLVDMAASDPAMAASRPDWVATQDMAVHGAARLDEGPVVVDAHLVRVGKKVVAVAADVYDGHGVDDLAALRAGIDRRSSGTGSTPTLTGSGLVTFARLPGAAAPGMDDYDPARWVGAVRHRSSGAPSERSLRERMGLELLDRASGRLALECTPYVANSIGTISGGAQAMLIEAAAGTVRPGMVAADVQLHYLSQVEAGPAVTRATVLRDAADHTVVRVEVVDAGNDDRVLTLATVTLRTPA